MEILQLLQSKNSFITDRAAKAIAIKAHYDNNEISKEEYDELCKDLVKMEVIAYNMHRIDEQIELDKAFGIIEKFLSVVL